MIDLHCHSNYSDGLLSPADLLLKALNTGVRVLALTDHDSTAGVSELIQAAQAHAIQIIPGIELSVCWKKYSIHVLGLQISLADNGLVAVIEMQNERRIARAKAIGLALERVGIAHAYQKACDLAGHDRIGRAHYAQLLLLEGLVQTPKLAFTRYLGQGKVAYVPSTWINLSEAVSVIRKAGGQAVIAHPFKYRLTRTKLKELIQDFKYAGGEGLEVVSGEMLDKDIQTMATLCNKFEMVASSGSDFHGHGVSRVGLGRQKPLPSISTPIWSAWGLS